MIYLDGMTAYSANVPSYLRLGVELLRTSSLAVRAEAMLACLACITDPGYARPRLLESVRCVHHQRNTYTYGELEGIFIPRSQPDLWLHFRLHMDTRPCLAGGSS